MSKVKFMLATAVAFGLLSAFSPEALPDEIPFNVRVSSEFVPGTGGECLSCLGPFSRIGQTRFEPGESKHFYSAAINFLSPFGNWTCCRIPGNLCGSIPAICLGSDPNVKFCLESNPFTTTSVNIDISQNGSLSADVAGRCGRRSTSASLGDDSKFRRPDTDTFSIEATEGDELVVTLEQDPTTGNTGTDATLTFRDSIPGLSLAESTSGLLPLELRPTAPATGKYEIVVDHRGLSEDMRYRGGYIISVAGLSDDEDQVIAPGEDVEE